jgi:hypothetical protein
MNEFLNILNYLRVYYTHIYIQQITCLFYRTYLCPLVVLTSPMVVSIRIPTWWVYTFLFMRVMSSGM